jgi:hypothetical protein
MREWTRGCGHLLSGQSDVEKPRRKSLVRLCRYNAGREYGKHHYQCLGLRCNRYLRERIAGDRREESSVRGPETIRLEGKIRR